MTTRLVPPQTIVTLLKNRQRPVVLLGAGASVPSGLPTAAELVSEIAWWGYCKETATNLDDKTLSSFKVETWLAEQQWFRNDVPIAALYPIAVEAVLQPREDRREFFQRVLNRPLKPSPGYTFLAELLHLGILDHVLTTNFDSLLATQYRSRYTSARITEIKTPYDFRLFSVNPRRPQIIYLHGSVDHYTDQNLEDETRILNQELTELLVPLLRDNPLVVMGYRGAEPSVMRHLLISNAERCGGFRRGIFWCTRSDNVVDDSLLPELAAVANTNLQFVNIKGFDECMGVIYAAVTNIPPVAAPISTNNRHHDGIVTKNGLRRSGLFLLIALPSLFMHPLVPYSPPPIHFLEPIPLLSTGADWEVGEIVGADLNKDGIPDLIAVNNNGEGIAVFLGLGNGRFQEPRMYKTGKVPYAAVLADVNRDGNLDIIVSNTGGRDFQKPAPGSLSVLIGIGDGTFKEAENYDVGSHPTVPVVGYFNNDPYPDLAVGSWSEKYITVLLGSKDGTFKKAKQYPVNIQTSSIGVGDFNSDHHLDLVVANTSNSEVKVFLGRGDGTFAEGQSFPTQLAADHKEQWWGVYSVSVADINKDGRPDLVVTNYSDDNVGVLIGRGDGTFAPPVVYPTASGPFSAIVTDINGDGRQDFIVSTNSGQVSVLLGDASGHFEEAGPFPTGGSTTSVVVADFNGDGRLDLAVSNRDSSLISLLLSGKRPTETRFDVLSPNPCTYSLACVFRATVTSTRGIPEGKVVLHDGSTVLVQANLYRGEAEVTVSSLKKGFHPLRMEYQATDLYGSSTSADVWLQVQ